MTIILTKYKHNHIISSFVIVQKKSGYINQEKNATKKTNR